MKILSKQMSATKKIVSVSILASLILSVLAAQINVASAFVVNCNQINPDKLPDDEYLQALYDGPGTFEPVSLYASQIKDRFEEVARVKKEIYLSTHPNDQLTDEAFCPDLDDPSFGKCPEIEGYTDENTQKVEGFYSLYRNEFATEIEKIFQNKSSNTSLTSTAIMVFNEYATKQDMLCGIFHYYLFSNVQADFKDANLKCQNTLQTNLNEHYADCKNALVKAVNSSEQLMMEHIKSTAAEKKATLLVEKYKAINTKLRELNNSVARMYAFFQTFANKLLFKADKQMQSF